MTERGGRNKVLIIIAAIVAPSLAAVLAGLLLGAQIELGLVIFTSILGLVLGWFLHRGRSTARYYLAFVFLLIVAGFGLLAISPPYSVVNLVSTLVGALCGWAGWALLKSTDIEAFLEKQRRMREGVLTLTGLDGV